MPRAVFLSYRTDNWRLVRAEATLWKRVNQVKDDKLLKDDELVRKAPIWTDLSSIWPLTKPKGGKSLFLEELDTSYKKHLLRSAPQIFARRWTEHPSVLATIDDLVAEAINLRSSRGQRIRGRAKYVRHLKVILIDLWVAAVLSTNRYRSISMRKEEYQKPTRYKRIFLKYDYVVAVLSDMTELGYVEKNPGFRFPLGGKVSYRTRIAATEKFLEKVHAASMPTSGLIKIVSKLVTDPDSGEDLRDESIVLRDKDKNNIPYADTPDTIRMRNNLATINEKLSATHITLCCTDEEFSDIQERLKKKTDKQPRKLDFTSTSLYRVFNETFDWGGRYYGGWWEELPKEFRKFIEINHKNTVELDYSGHHFRILYAREKLVAPADPYDIPSFNRGDLKLVGVIMLNASDRVDAINTARYNRKVKQAKELVDALEKHHAPISHHFYTGVGRELQRLDSDIAEEVMLKMLKRGATVLPVHDSFIVRASYDVELEEIMTEAFEGRYGKASIKPKKTVLEDKEPRTRNFSDFHRVFGS